MLADVLMDALTKAIVGPLPGIRIGVGVRMLAVAGFNVVPAVSIVWRFVVPGSYSVDLLSDVVVNVLIDALSGARADVTIGVFVTSIGIGVLVAVNVNVFAAVLTALRDVTLAPVAVLSC